MKPKNKANLGLIALAFAGLSAHSAQAASQTWTNSASDLLWNTTSTNWTGVAWTNNNDAVFGATGAGSIAVASGVIVNDITFDTTGYTLTGNLTLANDQASTFTLNADETISAVIANNTAGASSLTKAGNSILTLSGANTYTGVTTINAGTLQLGAGGTTGALGSGAIVNNAALAFNYGATGNVGYANAISGTGSVSLAGTSGARVHFSGANTYSGATTINAGNNLEINNSVATSANSDHTVNGILDMYAGSGSLSPSIGALIGSGTVYGDNITTTLTVGANGHSGSFSGIISNGWGSGKIALTKAGAGTQTLSGANTYTGATKVSAGTLEVTTGGAIANTDGGFEVGNTANTNAVLAVTGGSVSDSTTNGNQWSSYLQVGNGANMRGFVQMTSGSLNARRHLFLGNTGGYGAMSMSAGNLSVGSYFITGFAAGYGVFNQTGGAVSAGGSFPSPVLVASGAGSVGVMNLSGGTFSATGGFQLPENGASTGILNISGNASVTALTGTGIQFGGDANDSVGILNLLGGTLRTNIVRKNSTGPNSLGLFNFNGGTLKAGAASATFMTGLSNAYVRSGGGTIDNNGFGITIGQDLIAPTGSGVSATGLAITGGSGYVDTPVVVVSGGGGTGATAVATVSGGVVTGITITNPGVDYTSVPTFTLTGGGGSGASVGAGTATVVANTSGGMTFSGAGTTTLPSVNSYTGPTILSGGTLNLTGSISGSPMTIGAATLVGNGSVGAVTVNNAGAVITNGNANTDTLSLGSLAFSTGATLNLSKFNDTDTPALSVTGNLTSSSGITVNLTTAPTWSPGAYNLISYGSFTGAASHFVKGTIPGLGGRQSATLGKTPGTGAGFITLTIAGDTPVWTGAGSQTWTTVATDNNVGPNAWALKTVHSATNFWANDSVEFNDTYNLFPDGDVTVTNSTVTIHGGVAPTSTAFNNFLVNYTVNSNDSTGITSGALSKTGDGTVTLTTTNSYTGATTINAGTLELGNGTTDGDIATSSNIANEGTLIYNRASGSFTYGNVISGFGEVIKNGAGTQILTGANTRSGLTTINSGTLQVGNAGTTGALGSGLITNNASLVFNRSNAVAQGTDFGAIDGTGSVTQAGSGTLTLSSFNTYSGGTTVNSGTTIAASGADAFGTGAVTVNGGTITNAGDAGVGNAIVVGAGGVSISIGANQNFSFYGALSGAGDINLASTAFVKSLNWDFSANTMTSGTVTMAAGGNNTTVLRFNNPNSTSAALDWVLNGAADRGITVGAEGTYHFGSLAGSGILQGNFQPAATLSLGGNNHSADFAGSIRDNGSIVSVIKVGTGTQTLSGANTYTGDTTVNGGVLAVDGGSIVDTNKLVIDGGKVDPLGGTEVVGTLYFGTTQKASGTWGATGSGADHEDDTHFTGTGVVKVTTGPAVVGYSSWAELNGATGTMDQDHDNDGVDNGIEYFIGGPNGNTTGFTATPGPVSGTVTWTMGLGYAGAYGADYEVQTSTDLVTWIQAPEGTGPNTVAVTAGTSVVYAMPTGGKSFVRLVVHN